MGREMKIDKFIAIRTYLGMSQPVFAEYLGVSESSVGMIEAGRRRISKTMIGKIAKKFEETPEFLAYYARIKKLSD
jgi:DNA-binding transcriptional regulator YiaG